MAGIIGKIFGFCSAGSVERNYSAGVKVEAAVPVRGDSVVFSAGAGSISDVEVLHNGEAVEGADAQVSGGGASVQASAGESSANAQLPERPMRENFASDAEFDSAYCDYQTANMKNLIKEYPNAVVYSSVCYGCNIPPEEVFKNGIPAKGGSDFDVIRHQREVDKDGKYDAANSALRGSCDNAMVPAKFAGKGGFVYKLKPLGGAIDVEAAICRPRHLNPVTLQYEGNMFSGEQEISIGSRQPACQIEGYYEVGEYNETHDAHKLGKFVPNPDYKPQ
ncbi:MAG: hypothetical protein LWY06_15505 [Firmicutes bacterium]|nr:hypothetical protein [Bacillota bacterium]